MSKDKITILFGAEKITLLYSLYPFWTSPNRDRFDFSTDLEWALKKDKNKFILLVRCFKTFTTREQRMDFILQLKKKYEKVFLFDDNDGAESYFLDLLPVVDKYYKKQIYTDLNNYSKAFVWDRIYTHFYQDSSNQHSASLIPTVSETPTRKELEKISLLWNIGIGQYPLSRIKNLLAKESVKKFGKLVMPLLLTKRELNRKIPTPQNAKCHARFGYTEYPEIVGYQRKLFLETLRRDDRFMVGKVSPKLYKKEIKEVKAVFSPYGWGEVCFRDFEAIINGAVLIKPDMGHLRTWPNVFVPYETFIPVKWDGSDVLEQTEQLFEDPQLMSKLTHNAWNVYHSAFPELESRVLEIIQSFEE
jgi:hypothetical protein